MSPAPVISKLNVTCGGLFLDPLSSLRSRRLPGRRSVWRRETGTRASGSRTFLAPVLPREKLRLLLPREKDTTVIPAASTRSSTWHSCAVHAEMSGMSGIAHAWKDYWAWTGGNIGAMPLEFVITTAVTWLFRKKVAAFMRRFAETAVSEVHEHLARVHEEIRNLRESHEGMRAEINRQEYPERGGAGDHDAGFGERGSAP